MSLSALSSIALFSPVIASNAIFSTRRASKGVDSIEENPLYGVANMNIAGAQILKGSRAVKSLIIATDPLLENCNKGAKDHILNFSNKNLNIIKENPIYKTTGKVLNYTAKNINPVIVATGVYDVATSEDKVDTWARESTSLLTMFGAEAVANDIVGMPTFNIVKGKNKFGFRRSRGLKLAQNILSDEQYNLVHKFLNKNKKTKLFASSAKGLFFAGSSILGYKAGDKISDTILGEKDVA